MNTFPRSWLYLLLLMELLTCFNIAAQESPKQMVTLTVEHPNDPESLKTMITDHLADGKPELAIPYMEAFLALGDSSGSTPGEQAWLYLQLADGYGKAGEEKLAAKNLLRSVPLAGKEFGTNTKNYQDFVFTVAGTLFGAGHHLEAEPLYLELFQADTLYETENREAEICTNLFTFYGESGQYNKIRPVLERLLPYLKPVSTPGQFAGNLHTLGFLFYQEGRYDLAEKQMLESVDLYRKAFPAHHPSEGQVLIDLGMVYVKMGNYEQALRLADEGSSLLESLGKNDSAAGLKVNSIRAIGALINGQTGEAEVLYREILRNSPRGGAAELDYAINLGMLGTIYWFQKNYEKAEKSYLEAIELFRAARDTSWGMFANLKGNLGLVYLRTGAYDKAAGWARSSVESYRILNGEDHPDCLNHRVNRTISLEGAGETDAAVRESLVNNKAILDLIDRNLLYWSESEMESFMAQTAGRYIDYHHSLWLRNTGNQPALAGRMYDNQLFLKGVLLESSLKLHKAVASESDTLLQALLREQLKIRTTLEKIYALPPGQRMQDPALLQQEQIILQKKIKERVSQINASRGNNFNMLMAGETSFRDVREALKPGEAAIEFVSYKNTEPSRESNSIHYCALVLRKSDEWPHLVFLTTGDLLDSLANLHPDQLYDPGNRELYSRIWEPLTPYLQGITTIYYAPSGMLHRISFPAISPGNGETLSDRYAFTNLSSTRNVVTRKPVPQIKSGKVFGGIDYNRSTATEAPSPVNPVKDFPHSDPDREAFRNLRGSAWEFLPATRTEAMKVSQLLQQGNLQVTAIMGSEATEESFKAISDNSPSVIHVASHGFTIPTHEGDSLAMNLQNPGLPEKMIMADNPLLRSGLLFAGANQAWQSGAPPPGREDGILTAYEISHLDLSSTTLAVFSACQTGLGDIRGNEGVYGLQRALFMAGVNNLVVSLWEVPDLETMELMDCFYNHLVKGDLPEPAFRKAQDEMKEKYRDQPSLWAGFVFIR